MIKPTPQELQATLETDFRLGFYFAQREAYIADDEFSAALKAAGAYRWSPEHKNWTAEVRAARDRKIEADEISQMFWNESMRRASVKRAAEAKGGKQ